MAEINGVKVPFVPIVQNNEIPKNKGTRSTSRFEQMFKTELEKLSFSSHAVKRLESRDIHLSNEEISKLNEAVKKAQAKGSKDSLVMMNDTAFIVNIPNKTVVTAMYVGQGEENIFTNIDSVVFAP